MNIQFDPNFPVTKEAVEEIEGKEKVFDFLGHWPSFTDMEVLRLNLDRMERHPSIYSDLTAQFYIYDLSKSPNDKERRQGFLELLFTDVRDLRIEGWGHQNPLQGLSIQKRIEENLLSVAWGGGLGHEASFLCETIRIIRLRDRNPFREIQEWLLEQVVALNVANAPRVHSTLEKFHESNTHNNWISLGSLPI